MSNWQEAIYEANRHRVKGAQIIAVPTPDPLKIIRQAGKKPNKTEERFRLECLEVWLREGKIDRYGALESIRLNINGMFYSPDWPMWKDGQLSFAEVKGAFIHEDSIIKMKAFPLAYPEHPLWLYQWKGGVWIPQLIK